MCGNCKYYKPVAEVPHGLELYGYCRHPYGGFKGQLRYDYTAACKDGEITEMY